uniref:Uncharacterized protein n=1 Tax=Caenorhabditis japonica TaxID=281687 RepID=A0A8R1IVY6_CAEJA
MGLPSSYPVVVMSHSFPHRMEGTSVLNIQESLWAIQVATELKHFWEAPVPAWSAPMGTASRRTPIGECSLTRQATIRHTAINRNGKTLSSSASPPVDAQPEPPSLPMPPPTLAAFTRTMPTAISAISAVSA